MAANGVSLVVLNNRLPAIARALPRVTDQGCEKIARAVIALYQATAARDTGFMSGSGYVVTPALSTYAEITGDGPKLPEVAKPSGKTRAIGAIAAVYASFVEYGTRYMGAQPAFHPAVDDVIAALPVILGDFEKRLNEASRLAA